MNEESSSNCDGYLVWDYFRGEVICSTTGEVVERIYDYTSTPLQKHGTSSISTTNNEASYKHNSLLKKYKRNLKIYRKALALVKNKPWLEIDFEKVIETGRFVNTIQSRNTIKALERINKMGMANILRRILMFIGNIDPVAVSRTERAKLALAYMLYKIIVGEKFSSREIIEIFNISLTTYKRLEKILKNILNRISLTEIRTVIH